MADKMSPRVIGTPKRSIGSVRKAEVTPTKLGTSPFKSFITSASPVGDDIVTENDYIDGVTLQDSSEDAFVEQEDVDKIDDLGTLSCPICEENMVSLRQLNRHLDDVHSGTLNPTSASGTAATAPTLGLSASSTPSPSPMKSSGSIDTDLRSIWLKKTNDVMLPIKKFAKLDIFDDSSRTSSTSSLGVLAGGTASPSGVNSRAEITVTKKHWQRPTGNDYCSVPNCPKRHNLNNCRKCGKLFCPAHFGYEVKLNSHANYEIFGKWSLCCEQCFTNKPGYNDFGSYRDLTQQFKSKRQAKLDKNQLYLNKLERRIIKLVNSLVKLYSNFSELNSNFFKLRLVLKQKEIERSIVNWEDESLVSHCYVCASSFSFTLRKHHCRICGRVCCASEETGCSKEIPIEYLASLVDISIRNEELKRQVGVRICVHCKDLLFIRKNFYRDTHAALGVLLKSFEMQQNIKKSILFNLPRFEALLVNIKNDKTNHENIHEISKLRKKLTNSFELFDRLTKEIISLGGLSSDETRIQNSIKLESVQFIQKNMVPLKKLPEILSSSSAAETVPQPVKLSRDEILRIKENRTNLMVLQEQSFLIQQMVKTAKANRKFDEVLTLENNLRDIQEQVRQVQAELGENGF